LRFWKDKREKETHMSMTWFASDKNRVAWGNQRVRDKVVQDWLRARVEKDAEEKKRELGDRYEGVGDYDAVLRSHCRF
jgi:hypothetical protein